MGARVTTDPFTFWLLSIVVLVAGLDFLLGKPGRKRLQAYLALFYRLRMVVIAVISGDLKRLVSLSLSDIRFLLHFFAVGGNVGSIIVGGSPGEPSIEGLLPYAPAYGAFNDLATAAIRFVLFLATFFSWLVIRPAHKGLSLVILRFAEAEKGPLTLLAAALAAVAKLLQMLLSSR
jgi:hypothetical protein